MLVLRRVFFAVTAILLTGSSALAADDGPQCRDVAGDQGIAICSRFIASGAAAKPDLALAYFHRGIKYWPKGDYDRALADLTEAIKINPKYAPAFGHRGWVWHLKGDYERAIGDADQAIKLDAKLDYPWFNRGAAWQAKGDAVRAIADYTAAVRVNRNHATAWFNRGNLYWLRGDHDLAISDLSEAIRVDANYAVAYGHRGWVWHLKRDYDRAIADAGQAIRIDPNLDFPYFNRGESWQAKNDLTRAIADYSEAIRVNPKYVNALTGRALAYERLGDFARALADFRAALAIDPKWPNGAERVARLQQKIAAPAAPSAAPQAVPPGSRVALIIGNSKYAKVPPLTNPKNDAEKLAASLRQQGFAKVTVRHDLSRDQLVDALKGFAGDAANADWAVVYFAGHGIEFGGINYLVPIDARLDSDRDVSFEAVELDRVLFAVEGAKKLRLIILDACRDNPFAKTMKRSLSTRSVGRGLAQIEPEGATLVAYAAKHGQTAEDGEGGNSPFVSALVKHIPTPGLEINLLFRKVRDEVLAATSKRQEPFMYGSLPSDPFYFRN
jgi:tetratricopeptide (TPR) repeat protein